MSPPIKRILSHTRLRHIPATGFGWIDRRLVTLGLLADLSGNEALLYFFLCAVADKDGISFWGDRRICSSIHISNDSLDRARRNLEHRGLILYRHPLYQILALPDELRPAPIRNQDSPRPRNTAQPTEPRTIGDILRTSPIIPAHHRSRSDHHHKA